MMPPRTTLNCPRVVLKLIAMLGVINLVLAQANTPPNIVLIISDDHAFNDYGFMGNPVAQTPNIDRLASQSLLYTRGYVMPVCSPSLASLLTGELPHDHGITGNDLGESAMQLENAKDRRDRAPLTQRLLKNPLLLPEALSAADYLTFQTGKLWNVTAQEIGFTDGMTNHTGRHGRPGLAIGRKTMEPMFRFMKRGAHAKKPFFVWYAPLLPHDPHNPPQELLDKNTNTGLSQIAAKYYSTVEWFDATCGQLDTFLEQNDLDKNTVLINLADNGWDSEKHGGRA